MYLTIAIPTYNRNEILKKNILLLLPQLTDECKLLIIDNHSDVPVDETLKLVLSEYAHINCKIIRNKVNIGGNANIIRCFEMCETEWLWVLGDDDIVKEDAVKTIISHIHKLNDYTFLNYYWVADNHPLRDKAIFTTGIEEFIKNIDFMGFIGFISSSIYNVSKVISEIRVGYMMIASCHPHIAMLFASLKDSGKCALLPEQIVTYSGTGAPNFHGFILYVLLGWPLLLDLPFLNSASRHYLKLQLSKLTNPLLVGGTANYLAHKHYIEHERDESLYFYKTIDQRFFSLSRSFYVKFMRYVCYFWVKYPRLFLPLLKIIYKRLKGKDYEFINTIQW